MLSSLGYRGGDHGGGAVSFKDSLLESGWMELHHLENQTLKPSAIQNYGPDSSAGSQWVPLRTRLFSFSGGRGEIGEPPGKVLESD